MSMKPFNTSKIGWELWTKRGLWASIWYAYFPDLVGLILNMDGHDVARGFLYKERHIGPIYYDDRASGGWYQDEHGNYVPKSITSIRTARTAFIELMLDMGVKKRVIGNIGIDTFAVPGVEFQNEVYCPLPHVDFVSKPFGVTYDNETKQFVFNNEGKLIVTSTYDYPMWLTSQLQGAGKYGSSEKLFDEYFRSLQGGNLEA